MVNPKVITHNHIKDPFLNIWNPNLAQEHHPQLQESWWRIGQSWQYKKRNFKESFFLQNFLKITSRVEINLKNVHQDPPVLHRSNYRAGGRVQSWQGEWRILKKLSLQNLLKITYWVKINLRIVHQDPPVCHRSTYRAGGLVQSWEGDWRIEGLKEDRGVLMTFLSACIIDLGNLGQCLSRQLLCKLLFS